MLPYLWLIIMMFCNLVKTKYFRNRNMKCGAFDKNVFILKTVFWWGQIAFVCRGQKVGESYCLVVKVLRLSKSKISLSIAEYKWLDRRSYCFGTYIYIWFNTSMYFYGKPLSTKTDDFLQLQISMCMSCCSFVSSDRSSYSDSGL